MRLSITAALLSIYLRIGSTLSQQPVCTAEENCDAEEAPCGLWLAPSTLFRGSLGIFAGVDVEQGETVGDGDLLVPIFDPNMNEWSLWHENVWNRDIQDDLILQNYYQLKAFIPGVGSNVLCSDLLGNINARGGEVDSVDVHRSKDASAGSFGDRHAFESGYGDAGLASRE